MWSELIKEMAKELNYTACNSCKVKDNIKDEKDIKCEENYNCKYEFSQEEFLKIPQYLYNKDKHKYYKIIKEVLDKEKEANALNDIIFRLNPRHIITTNYDRLFETSNEPNSVMYEPIYKDIDLLKAKGNHYLIKMHGDIKDLKNTVLKDDDYLYYIQNHILIENYIKSLLIAHTFLFIGYSLNASNLKLIMAWIDYFVQHCKTLRPKNYILTIDEAFSKEEIKKYWEYKNIYIISSKECPDIALNKAKETKLEKKAYSLYGTLECILDQQGAFFMNGFRSLEEFINETYNRLLVFNSFKYVSFYSLMNTLDIINYIKIMDELELKDHILYEKLKSIFTLDGEKVEYIKSIFIKAKIYRISYESYSFEIKLKQEINDLNEYLFYYYLTQNFILVNRILKECHNKIDDLTQVYYKCLIIKDKKKIRKFLQYCCSSKYNFNTLYSLIVYKLNYCSLNNFKGSDDIVSIRNTILTNDRFNDKLAYSYLLETCSSMEKYIIKMRNLYRKYKKASEYNNRNIEFFELQAIASDYYYFIRYNNILIDFWSNPNEFMEYYIKSLFYYYMLTNKSKLDRKSIYCLELIDSDILLSFIDYKDLNDLVNKYRINNFYFGVSISHIFSNYLRNFEKFWRMDMNNSFNNLCLLISISMGNKLEIVQLFFEYLENVNLNKAKLFTKCIDGIYELVKNSEIKKYSDVENIIKFLMTKDVADEAFNSTQHTKYDNIIISLYNKIVDQKDESSLHNINTYIDALETNIILSDTNGTNFKKHLKEILKLE